METQITLNLDRSVPVVDAIFRLMEGTGSEAEAIELLSEAEISAE